jgi:hypothetical protein
MGPSPRPNNTGIKEQPKRRPGNGTPQRRQRDRRTQLVARHADPHPRTRVQDIPPHQPDEYTTENVKSAATARRTPKDLRLGPEVGQNLRDGPVGGVGRRGQLIAGQRAGQAAQAVVRAAQCGDPRRGSVVMGSPSRVVVSSADRTTRPRKQRPPHAGRPRPGDAGMPTTRFCSLIGVPERTWRRHQARIRRGRQPKRPWPRPTRDKIREAAVGMR